MRALTSLTILGSCLSVVSGLDVKFYNGRSCQLEVLDHVHEDNVSVLVTLANAPRSLSYPSIFVGNLPGGERNKCWAWDGFGCSGNGGQLHLNTGSNAGCFNPGAHMSSIKSVCCSIAQGQGRTNNNMYQLNIVPPVA
ncbi:hypothetical protein NQ176_g3299 [Zarea fungicola]|uniref:Uncharacterized protein n=1 Tax=Zarea fungicola TaxID=93591 RepID=A0ACC1NKI1_9HYPO|nr:hypothetical protein NQ176_g3299 [Lecanicillium fungicola]